MSLVHLLMPDSQLSPVPPNSTNMASIMRSITVAAALLAAASPTLAKDCQQRDDVLRYGSPESVGMLSQPLKEMEANLTHFTEARNWGSKTSNQVVPIEPGASSLSVHGLPV